MARGEIQLTVQTTAGAAVSGASATVNIRGGGLATVYAAATGGTTASNPITTAANGRIDGWLDEGSYDIQISGAGITTYTQPVEIVNGAAMNAFDGARISAATVPTAALAALAVTGAKIALQTVTKDKLDPNVLPIGTIIPYWRPTNSHALPTGWLEANGASVIAANHDFTGGGTITLPDLRNKYLLGADSTKAIGTAGTVNNLVGGAPGVSTGGDTNAGGANVRDISHTHTIAHTHDYSHTHGMPDHTHTFTTPDHLHNFGSLYYVFGTNQNTGVYAIANSVQTGAADRSLSGTTSGASNGNTTTSQSVSTTGAASAANSGTSLSATQDWRPLSYGVIFLIKVKAT
jgi:hypothetical protein